MIVRNRLIALLYRVIAFATMATLLTFYRTSFASFWVAISCFDVEISIVITTMFAFEIVFNLIDMRHGIHGVAAGPYMPMALPCIAFALFAGTVYFAFSMPSGSAPTDQIALWLHVALLVLPLLDWILFDEKGTVRLSASFTCQLYPILYFVFGYFRTVIWDETPIYGTNMYAYPFLDFLQPGIVWHAALFFLGTIGANLLLILFNNFFTGRYRRGGHQIE